MLQPTVPLRFPLGDNSGITLSRTEKGLFYVSWNHHDDSGKVICQCLLPHAIKQHSQDFETGYDGSTSCLHEGGPADLALNILIAFFPTPPCPVTTEDLVAARLLGGIDHADGIDSGRRESTRLLKLMEDYEEATVLCSRGQRVSRIAWYLHQGFKCQFLSMPLAPGKEQIIPGRVIREWAYDKLEESETEDYLARAA